MDIPNGWRVCGENMFAKHTIGYDELKSFFLAFSIWSHNDICLNWSQFEAYCKVIGVQHVHVLYRGKWNEKKVKQLIKSDDYEEGFVVRIEEQFHIDDFSTSVAK